MKYIVGLVCLCALVSCASVRSLPYAEPISGGWHVACHWDNRDSCLQLLEDHCPNGYVITSENSTIDMSAYCR